MIEVLMLLAVFATNILKPLSKALEDYDGLMSLAELIFEGLFLFFVLKEFKMTKKSFEWTKKDRREEKTKRELRYFVWIVINDFTDKYKIFVDTNDREVLKLIIHCDKEIINELCKQISNKRFLPLSFCEYVITSSIKQLTKQFQEGEIIDYNNIYNYFYKSANNIFMMDTLTPPFINQRHKYFNSVEEIDEIYEKLTNFKL